MNGNDSNSGEASAAFRRLILGVFAFMMIVAVAKVGTAQVLYSTFAGTITDTSGAVVPGAQVTFTNEGTHLERTVTTNSSGGYTAATLPAGTYDVKVTKAGFKTYARSGIDLAYNTVGRVDATLAVGAVTQTVLVTGAPPLLQTNRADVHHNITTVQIENIPLAPGNNFEHLLQAVPGVTPPTTAHSIPTNPTLSFAFTSNGTSDMGNSILIDGVSQWNMWVPESAAYIPSSDSIQTVNVTTNSYDINQGFAGGSSTSVEIKSGTNQFHGDAYEYHYDNKLNALEFFAPHDHLTRTPKEVYNLFGGSIGGPIKKNKLFFFSNVELTRDYEFAHVNTTMPSPAMIQGDLRNVPGTPGAVLGSTASNPDVVYDPLTGDASGNNRAQIFATNNAADASTFNQLCQAGDPGSILMGNGFTECPNVIPTSRISPVATALMKLMPGQNLPTSTNYEPDSNFSANGDVNYRRITTDDKINWNATDKFTMFGHLGFLHYTTYNPQVYGPLGGDQLSGFIGNEGAGYGHTITASVTGNYVATPNLVIDGNFGFTREATNVAQLDIGTKEGQNLAWVNNAGQAGKGILGVNGTRPFEGSWPQFSISNFDVLGTQHNFMPYYRNDPQFLWSGNANWIHGKHTVNFGGAYEVQHLNQQQPEWNAGGTSWPAAGGFSFGAGPTQCANCSSSGKASSSNNYNDFGTFLLGLDTGWGRNIQVPNYFHTSTQMFGLYVGDTWQAAKKLTATYGVRWEYYPFPTRSGTPAGVEKYDFTTGQMLNCGEGGNPIDCGTKVGYKYFAPRLGLAYSPTSTLVVRAGYGLSFDPWNLIDNLRTNFPILIPLNENTPNSYTAAGVLNAQDVQNTPAGECTTYSGFCFGSGGTLPEGVQLPPSLPSSISGLNALLTTASNPIPGNVNLITATNNYKRGYIMSWNLTVQKQFPGNWVASAGYVATRTVNQSGVLDLNAAQQPGVGSAGVPFFYNGSNKAICTSASSSALGCRTGGTNIITPLASAHYDSLQATLVHHFAKGLDVHLAYTWSRFLGEAGSAGGTTGGMDQKGQLYIPATAYYGLNYGISPGDRPQNLEATFVWQPPLGAGKSFATSGISSKILGGWQLSSILTSVSNFPVEMTADGGTLNMPGNTQRPDRLCSSVGTPKAVGYGQNWFDTSCFSGVNTARFGNSAFYIFHGPHQFNLDAGLFRNFKLTERFNLQFRAQAFNFTNTPAFSDPNGSCGTIPSGANSGCHGSSFGQVRGTANFARPTGDSRLFEFNARLSF